MRAYLAYLAHVQGEIILALTYLVIVLPVWALLRLMRRDLLGARRAGWLRHPRVGDALADLKQPF